jgi:beta-galactosidase
VPELWSGWFDMRGGKHNRMNVKNYTTIYEEIVFKMNASVSLYMFIGGTNFGFMGGENLTTSYDYDAPLDESGFRLFAFLMMSSY